jgi:hypothetical protein
MIPMPMLSDNTVNSYDVDVDVRASQPNETFNPGSENAILEHVIINIQQYHM